MAINFYDFLNAKVFYVLVVFDAKIHLLHLDHSYLKSFVFVVSPFYFYFFMSCHLSYLKH